MRTFMLARWALLFYLFVNSTAFAQDFFAPEFNLEIPPLGSSMIAKSNIDQACLDALDEWPTRTITHPDDDSMIWKLHLGKHPDCGFDEESYLFKAVLVEPDGNVYFFELMKYFDYDLEEKFLSLHKTGAKQITLELVDYSGGMHCCYTSHYFIYKNGKLAGVTIQNWGHALPDYEDFDKDGHIEIGVYDSSFAYKLGSFAHSGYSWPRLFFDVNANGFALNWQLVRQYAEELKHKPDPDWVKNWDNKERAYHLKTAQLFFQYSAAGEHEYAEQFLRQSYAEQDIIRIKNNELSIDQLYQQYKLLICNSLFQQTVYYCRDSSA